MPGTGQGSTWNWCSWVVHCLLHSKNAGRRPGKPVAVRWSWASLVISPPQLPGTSFSKDVGGPRVYRHCFCWRWALSRSLVTSYRASCIGAIVHPRAMLLLCRGNVQREGYLTLRLLGSQLQMERGNISRLSQCHDLTCCSQNGLCDCILGRLVQRH